MVKSMQISGAFVCAPARQRHSNRAQLPARTTHVSLVQDRADYNCQHKCRVRRDTGENPDEMQRSRVRRWSLIRRQRSSARRWMYIYNYIVTKRVIH